MPGQDNAAGRTVAPVAPDGPAPSLLLVVCDDGHRAVIDHAPTAAQRAALAELGACGLDGFRWDERAEAFDVDPAAPHPADAADGFRTAAELAFTEALRHGVVPTALGVRHDAGLARRAARALAGVA